MGFFTSSHVIVKVLLASRTMKLMSVWSSSLEDLEPWSNEHGKYHLRLLLPVLCTSCLPSSEVQPTTVAELQPVSAHEYSRNMHNSQLFYRRIFRTWTESPHTPIWVLYIERRL